MYRPADRTPGPGGSRDPFSGLRRTVSADFRRRIPHAGIRPASCKTSRQERLPAGTGDPVPGGEAGRESENECLSHHRPDGTGFLRGVGIGLLAGATFGAVMGATSYSGPDMFFSSAGEAAAAGALVFGIVGVPIGGLFGLAASGVDDANVPLESSEVAVSLAPSREHDLVVATSWRF